MAWVKLIRRKRSADAVLASLIKWSSISIVGSCLMGVVGIGVGAWCYGVFWSLLQSGLLVGHERTLLWICALIPFLLAGMGLADALDNWATRRCLRFIQTEMRTSGGAALPRRESQEPPTTGGGEGSQLEAASLVDGVRRAPSARNILLIVGSVVGIVLLGIFLWQAVLRRPNNGYSPVTGTYAARVYERVDKQTLTVNQMALVKFDLELGDWVVCNFRVVEGGNINFHILKPDGTSLVDSVGTSGERRGIEVVYTPGRYAFVFDNTKAWFDERTVEVSWRSNRPVPRLQVRSQ